MSTVKAIIKKDKINARKQVPVYIRITHRRHSAFIATGIKISNSDWDSKKCTIKSSYGAYKRANALIQDKIDKCHKAIYNYELNDKQFTARMIRDIVVNDNYDCLLTYARQWIDDRKERNAITISSHKKYSGIIDKLDKCFKGKLSIGEFDVEALKKYEHYLIHVVGNKQNTISSNFSFLRALANALIKDDLMDLNDYPFRKWKLKYKPAKRKYLTPDQIKQTERLILRAGSKIELCRQIFLFCTQTGLRIGDALHLKKENYNGSHIILLSQKTKDRHTLLLTAKAKTILEGNIEGKEDNDYVFDFLTHERQINEEESLREQKCVTALINKNLGIISERCGFDFKISTHYARHSMATNALSKGLSLEEIKAVLNHRDVKTTQLYAKNVNSFVDQAIRKLG